MQIGFSVQKRSKKKKRIVCTNAYCAISIIAQARFILLAFCSHNLFSAYFFFVFVHSSLDSGVVYVFVCKNTRSILAASNQEYFAVFIRHTMSAGYHENKCIEIKLVSMQLLHFNKLFH